MIKKILKPAIASLLLTTSLSAWEKGEKIDLTYQDQFEQTHNITSDVKRLLIAFSKEDGKKINAFMQNKPKGWLEERQAKIAMDASEVPSLIMSLFMLPKFEDYTYALGIIEEESVVEKLNSQEGFLTCYHFSNGAITDIEFIKQAEEIDRCLNAKD